MRIRSLVVTLALVLAGCTTPRTPGPVIAPPAPAPAPAPTPGPPPAQALAFGDLPGWAEEDHRAALEAYRASCGVARAPVDAAACRAARALGPVDEAAARAFLESRFRPEALQGEGLLTAYFAPIYNARTARNDEFSAAVRGRPDDLVIVDLAEIDPSASPGQKLIRRLVDGKLEPYPDRATIEATPEKAPLAWMRPEDLFFLQIQGSGTLVFEDGSRRKISFAAHNGQPFTGIARPMREKGLLADANTSGDAIRRWLADHRGPEADAIMALNPRYAFFSLSQDDGREPAGAAGIPLTPGRSIAIDPARHAMGELFWISASAPVLNGAFPVYRRLVVALDTGGAIKGDVRADLYMGRGDAAGSAAGRVRHTLRMYRLVPVETGGS